MNQSRRMSLVEACLNTASGFIVSLVVWHFLALGMHIPMTVTENLFITGVFTVVSVVRSYVWRRVFNQWRTA